MDKEETFLSRKLHIDMVWTFLDLFIRPKNLYLKFSENLAALIFLREKVSTFAESKLYMYTLSLLITRLQYAKRLSPIIAR